MLSAPDSASQIRTVRSSDAVASRHPSGAHTPPNSAVVTTQYRTPALGTNLGYRTAGQISDQVSSVKVGS